MANLAELKDKIIKKAEIDSDFRKELKTSAKKAIEKYFPKYSGAGIPEDLKFVVCEDSASTIYLNVSPIDSMRRRY